MLIDTINIFYIRWFKRKKRPRHTARDEVNRGTTLFDGLLRPLNLLTPATYFAKYHKVSIHSEFNTNCTGSHQPPAF